MTHTQDRLRSKIKHLNLQIKNMERDIPKVQKEIESTTDKFRKMQGQALINRMNKAIKGSKRDIKLMEMQL